MRGRRLLFGLVLGASLATNAYLLHARSRQPLPKPAPARPPDRIGSAAPPHRTRAVPPQPAAKPVPAAIATLDRATLEQQVRAAEARVDAMMPLYEKFDNATGGPENEARIRAVIDRVLGVEGSGQGPYELECRGDMCRFHTERPPREWQDALQFELLGMTRDMAFGDAVYLHLEDATTAAGKQYVIGIANALAMSPDLAACKRGHTVAGIVTVTLRLAGRRVEVAVSGPLAGTPVAACTRNVVDALVRATPLPDDVTSLPINELPVRVP